MGLKDLLKVDATSFKFKISNIKVYYLLVYIVQDHSMLNLHLVSQSVDIKHSAWLLAKLKCPGGNQVHVATFLHNKCPGCVIIWFPQRVILPIRYWQVQQYVRISVWDKSKATILKIATKTWAEDCCGLQRKAVAHFLPYTPCPSNHFCFLTRLVTKEVLWCVFSS